LVQWHPGCSGYGGAKNRLRIILGDADAWDSLTVLVHTDIKNYLFELFYPERNLSSLFVMLKESSQGIKSFTGIIKIRSSEPQPKAANAFSAFSKNSFWWGWNANQYPLCSSLLYSLETAHINAKEPSDEEYWVLVCLTKVASRCFSIRSTHFWWNATGVNFGVFVMLESSSSAMSSSFISSAVEKAKELI